MQHCLNAGDLSSFKNYSVRSEIAPVDDGSARRGIHDDDRLHPGLRVIQEDCHHYCFVDLDFFQAFVTPEMFAQPAKLMRCLPWPVGYPSLCLSWHQRK